ncbi:hypothetical protein [Burkholderia ubonensis]|uniref:hypothetical protein n=1 Tax=Burkholderia ubonensis TaxID=101571 RepID=UPI0012F9A699|nr:hypothetical protein [Burkholderia ubonensis]
MKMRTPTATTGRQSKYRPRKSTDRKAKLTRWHFQWLNGFIRQSGRPALLEFAQAELERAQTANREASSLLSVSVCPIHVHLRPLPAAPDEFVTLVKAIADAQLAVAGEELWRLEG